MGAVAVDGDPECMADASIEEDVAHPADVDVADSNGHADQVSRRPQPAGGSGGLPFDVRRHGAARVPGRTARQTCVFVVRDVCGWEAGGIRGS